MSELGDILRSARHRKGLSLDQVAAETRIQTHFLEALEEGQYSLLPGPVYITGFLRNYARCVDLHPDDVVQEYQAARPAPEPGVKAATRVLASGYERQTRTRVLWALAVVALMLAGGYAIKQYNDTYAHASAPPLNVTAATLGGSSTSSKPMLQKPVAAKQIRVQLRASAPVWVRVTADGARVFQGLLKPHAGTRHWIAHHSLYVVTYDGTKLRASYNGRQIGFLSSQPGLTVNVATLTGWQHVS